MNFICRIFVWVAFTVPFMTAQGQTLTFCSEGDPETLSPIFNSNTTSVDVTTQMFEGLVAMFGQGRAIWNQTSAGEATLPV